MSREPSEADSAIEGYVDALDHIRRVCRGSRTQTRRLRWIEARARCAVEGGEDWRDLDLPASADSASKRIFNLLARLSEERARREKAEEALKWYYSCCGGDPSDPAFKYFAQYPRVEQAQEGKK